MADQRVLITRRVPPPAVELLARAGCAADLIDSDEICPRAEFLKRLAGAAAAITMVTERVDDEALDAAGPALRIVANFAVGYDNIDVAACKRRGVLATNTPGVLTNATADLTWTLILAAARHAVAGDHLVRGGQWRGWTPTQLMGLELSGATLGILGAGRIGTAVGLRAVGFGMRVLYAHPRDNAELEQKAGATRVAFEQLLAESDVLTLHVPMKPENHHLLGAAELAKMKRTAVFVNTARGPLVDEAALLTALKTGRIAAAGLDVYEFEPRLTPGLTELPNAVLLPHIGSATVATRRRMSQMAAENIIAALAGRPALNPIA